MTTDQSLTAILDNLIDQWCERRALTPLRILLRAWPTDLALSDAWHELWRALRDVRGLGPEALTPRGGGTLRTSFATDRRGLESLRARPLCQCKRRRVAA